MRSAFNAQERILPFGMHHCRVPTPARDAWGAALPEAPDLAAELDDSVVLVESSHRPVGCNGFFPDTGRFDVADGDLKFSEAWKHHVSAQCHHQTPAFFDQQLDASEVEHAKR